MGSNYSPNSANYSPIIALILLSIANFSCIFLAFLKIPNNLPFINFVSILYSLLPLSVLIATVHSFFFYDIIFVLKRFTRRHQKMPYFFGFIFVIKSWVEIDYKNVVTSNICLQHIIQETLNISWVHLMCIHFYCNTVSSATFVNKML